MIQICFAKQTIKKLTINSKCNYNTSTTLLWDFKSSHTFNMHSNTEENTITAS